jgi:hypothetical protein
MTRRRISAARIPSKVQALAKSEALPGKIHWLCPFCGDWELNTDRHGGETIGATLVVCSGATCDSSCYWRQRELCGFGFEGFYFDASGDELDWWADERNILACLESAPDLGK